MKVLFWAREGRKIWRKILKFLENSVLGVCAKRFEVGLSGVLVFAPKSLVLRENAASGKFNIFILKFIGHYDLWWINI